MSFDTPTKNLSDTNHDTSSQPSPQGEGAKDNMNYQKSLELLTSQAKFHINLGLERMQKLAELFSNPQEELKIIHVAGTNGKGSVCATLAKICEMNGLKAGLFTSPHLLNYTERYKINSKEMSEEDFAKYLSIVEDKAQEYNIELTEFELLTMMAFIYFKEMKTDIVLLETGMGGRLDATNIIAKPILTIITSVSQDHNDRLGSTLEEIAFEKAGILKNETPLIISPTNKGLKTIKNMAKEVGAPILFADEDLQLIDVEKNIFTNGKENFKYNLRGLNQGQNLALIIKAAEFLKLDSSEGLKNVVWACRFQYDEKRNLIIDAAHNPDAISFLNKNLDLYFKNQPRMFLFGVLNTKDYKEIIKNLFRENDEIFVTDGFAANAVNKEILAGEIAKIYPQAKVKIVAINKIEEFLVKNANGIKICCGSFYLCSKVL